MPAAAAGRSLPGIGAGVSERSSLGLPVPVGPDAAEGTGCNRLWGAMGYETTGSAPSGACRWDRRPGLPLTVRSQKSWVAEGCRDDRTGGLGSGVRASGWSNRMSASPALTGRSGWVRTGRPPGPDPDVDDRSAVDPEGPADMDLTVAPFEGPIGVEPADAGDHGPARVAVAANLCGRVADTVRAAASGSGGTRRPCTTAGRGVRCGSAPL